MTCIFGKRWFVIDPEFDRRCKALFLNSYTDAAFGRLDGCRKAPRSCLAPILLVSRPRLEPGRRARRPK